MITPMDIAPLWGTLRKEFPLDGHIQPLDKGWSMIDLESIEIEGGEFLWGLVRYIKPDVVVETGTCWGLAAACIALALKQNHRGHLWSVEIEDYRLDFAITAFARLRESTGLDLEACTTFVHGDSMTDVVTSKLPPSGIDMLFIDGGDRVGEYQTYAPLLSPHGVTLVHDAGKQRDVHEFVHAQGGIFLPGARGIGVLQRG